MVKDAHIYAKTPMYMCTFHFSFRYSILLTLMIMMGNKKLGKYPTGIKRAKDGQDEIKTVHSYHILLIISSIAFIAILLLSFHPASLFCLSIYKLNCTFPLPSYTRTYLANSI